MTDPTNEKLAERLEAVEGYLAKIAEAFLLGQTATPLHVFGPANGGEATQVFTEAAEAANIAAARLRQPLPSGDGWTKIEDGEPEGDQEVYVVYRFDDGSRKVRRVLWFANAKTAKHVTHWQPARLPALPQEDE